MFRVCWSCVNVQQKYAFSVDSLSSPAVGTKKESKMAELLLFQLSN